MQRIALFLLSASALLAQPKPELLYPEGAPGAAGQEDQDKPSITAYLPNQSNGQAVVVCPGGGYRGLAMDHEGVQVAQWLNSQGIAAFVLKYRLGPRYRHPAMLLDVQRAIRMVRERAKSLGISPNRIGVMGFSAGGHLAATAGTHFDYGVPNAEDPIARMSSRPDFMVLCYPVISLTTEYTHQGSKSNLLGDNPPPPRGTDVEREAGPPRYAAHVPLSHQRGYRSAAGKQRALLPRAAQGEGASRNAHL